MKNILVAVLATAGEATEQNPADHPFLPYDELPVVHHPMDACPGLNEGTPREGWSANANQQDYEAALKNLDIEAVKKDIRALLTDATACPSWPADGGNYAGFMVRLAWHCSGSYRATDGRGGCAGGRQRFSPEGSWDDNANLDKARALLANIKHKYGVGLSWGDLFTLAGTEAIRSTGGKITQWCAGRVDEPDGSNSLDLGPSELQEKEAPCLGKNGECIGKNVSAKTNLATTTLQLIYVNPEGVLGNPDPAALVDDVRITFDRMGHSDEATVALIGGGHALGKAHGACPAGPGPSPQEVYAAHNKSYIPWPGLCGTGSGKDTFTSGFEGDFTTKPSTWDNEFFQLLKDRTWVKWKGPGDHWQWKIQGGTGAEAGVLRLTSDMALLEDPEYKKIVDLFAANMTAFDIAFDKAWTKLTHNGGNWARNRRCDAASFPEHLIQHNGMKSDDEAPEVIV